MIIARTNDNIRVPQDSGHHDIRGGGTHADAIIVVFLIDRGFGWRIRHHCLFSSILQRRVLGSGRFLPLRGPLLKYSESNYSNSGKCNTPVHQSRPVVIASCNLWGHNGRRWCWVIRWTHCGKFHDALLHIEAARIGIALLVASRERVTRFRINSVELVEGARRVFASTLVEVKVDGRKYDLEHVR